MHKRPGDTPGTRSERTYRIGGGQNNCARAGRKGTPQEPSATTVSVTVGRTEGDIRTASADQCITGPVVEPAAITNIPRKMNNAQPATAIHPSTTPAVAIPLPSSSRSRICWRLT